jgi:thioredoxin-like negative regulator of GroEL
MGLEALSCPGRHVQDVAATNEVRSMPTFLFIRDGHQIDKIVGANKQELVMKCNQYATSG